LVRLPFDLFVDAGENLIMVDDVATRSNLPVAPVEKEKLEDAPFDEAPLEESSKKMVRIRVVRLVWDR
jgi:hypothetical protein